MVHVHPWRLVAATLLVCILTSTAVARTVRVVMDDGRRLTGEVVEEGAETLILEIEGIRIPLDRSRISRLEEVRSVASEYRQRRDALANDDYQGRYRLAQWLYREQEYQLAKQELDDLTASMEHIASRSLRSDIEVLSRAVDAQLLLQQRENGGSSTTPTPDRPTPGTKPGDTPAAASALLTEEQVHLIRLFELRLMDENGRATRPSVIIPPATVEKLFARYQDEAEVPKTEADKSAFRRKPGYEQVELFFRVRARDLYPDIRIPNDPAAMRTWRLQIHPRYIVSYCGTAECHGKLKEDGTAVGGLFLNPRNPRDVRTVYTNFLVMHRYQAPNGYLAIERGDPSDSLLVQFSLPRDIALAPHPDVEGWQPRLPKTTSGPSPEQQMLLTWIGRELYRPTPRYPVNFRPAWMRSEESQTVQPGAGEAGPDDAATPIQPPAPAPARSNPFPN